MVIVAGWLKVDVEDRERFLERNRQTAQLARDAAGCLDFHLSADPLEADRINIFERWDDVASVEAFRGSGTPDEEAAQIRDGQVFQYEVASFEQL